MSKALIRELEIRLADLKLKQSIEMASLSPGELYLDDLKLTIGYVEKGLKNAATVALAK